jgi:Domain of unknown function (DUF4266)
MHRGLVLLCAVGLSASVTACVTVRPQQRAVLADPVMAFDGEPHFEAPRTHAIENREGSLGGSGVAGGGCGCN